MMHRILSINPGSTSTKIGIYEDEKEILVKTIRHSSEELSNFKTIYDQYQFRKDLIINILKEEQFDINSLSAVVGRGGLLKPIEGGTYEVNEKMLDDIKDCIQGEHASNLGAIIADEIAKKLNIQAFIVDPVVADELSDVARISGISQIKRKSIFHALNQKAVAKKYAKEINKDYEDINLIVAHLGGGVSVGAHQKGKVIDVNNALDGDGPFSPERSGGLPVGDLIKMCFSGKYTYEQVKKLIKGEGGFVNYLGTNDAREVEKMIEGGNEEAKLIYEAFCYQVANEIGRCAVCLSGKVDAIIITGGIAYSKFVTEYIKNRVSFIAPVIVYPGEDELLALAQGGLSVLNGYEKVREYK